MSQRLFSLVLLAGTGVGFAAFADDAPRLMPDRDVDITYRVTSGDKTSGKTVTERVRWLAADEMERIDPHGSGYLLHRSAYMLIDHRKKSADIIDPKHRLVTSITDPVVGELAEIENAKLMPLGTATVAKLSCAVWHAEIAANVEREVCLTGDGVLLRVRDGEKTLLEATAVKYHHISSKLFDIPPNYTAAPTAKSAPDFTSP